MPLLSDSCENEKLTEELQDMLLWGSSFGPISVAAQLMKVCLFDHPELSALGDGATDGFTVLINARRFSEALEEERLAPGLREGAWGLVLGGLAQGCAVAMGEALSDAMEAGRMSRQGGAVEPSAALSGVRVGAVSTARLLQVVLEAGDDNAAQAIAGASSQWRAERLRSSLAERLSEPESEADAAVGKVLKERGELTGALSERLGSGGRVEAGAAPAMALMSQACEAWQARDEGLRIEGALDGAAPAPGRRLPQKRRI